MKLICIGDSLTYGLGVPVEDSWTEILNRESPYQVINKGVNGDTSGGMLARLERDVFRENPKAVLVMGGANDFIMGCDTGVVKANLMAVIHQIRAARLAVLLCSEISGDIAHVRPDWAALSDFAAVDRKLTEMADWYKEFCRAFQVPYVNLYDDFKAAVKGRTEHYFFDGIHPNRAGHRLIADILLNRGMRAGKLP